MNTMSPIRGASLAGPSKDAADYLYETPLSVRRVMDRVVALYDNDDTIMRGGAIEAIAEGRAAYWTMAKYHNARAADLPLLLNAGVDIVRAIDGAYETRQESKHIALESIVPLNRKAVNELAKAYLHYGMSRDEAELEARRVRDPRPSLKRAPLTYANIKAGRV